MPSGVTYSVDSMFVKMEYIDKTKMYTRKQ